MSYRLKRKRQNAERHDITCGPYYSILQPLSFFVAPEAFFFQPKPKWMLFDRFWKEEFLCLDLFSRLTLLHCQKWNHSFLSRPRSQCFRSLNPFMFFNRLSILCSLQVVNTFNYLKGSVPRERRGVESILNRWLLLWDRGTGHFFPSGFSPHLVVNKFPFPVIPAQAVGILMQNVGMVVKTVLSDVTYSFWRR